MSQVRDVTAYMWRFLWFRSFVIFYVHRNFPGHKWLAFETPLMIGLLELFRKQGDLSMSAEVSRQLREYGDLP